MAKFNVKRHIIEQLQANIPLAEIKKELQNKGYQIEQINKAVREVIASVDKRMPSTTIIQIGVIVIGVVIAGSVLFYFSSNQSDLCKASAEKSSCENAVKVALDAYTGNVLSVGKKEVLLPPRRVGDFPLEVNAWVVLVGVKENEKITNLELVIDPTTFKILSVG